MERKYYRVTARCGHCGSKGKNFILIDYYVETVSRKDAAEKVRRFPRVQHDRKDAIRTVQEIEYEEYWYGCRRNNADPYLSCRSVQEQRSYGDLIADRIHYYDPEDFREEERPNLKKSCRYGYDRYGRRLKPAFEDLMIA